MKALKSIKFLSLSISLLSLTVFYSSVYAQEYDDMYFSKSDRKTVKVEKTTVLSKENKNHNNTNYKTISETTETYSAKNVNPEYIARYKSSESNETNDQSVNNDDSYSSQDYFVEGYDKDQYVSDSKKEEIDYAALNKRDQMSYSNYSRSNSSPSWRFSPYMSMGYGGYSGYGGYGRYGYDPFMMGHGSGMTMGIGFGFGSGFGYSPSMSYNIGMSWGTGYNPWGGYGNPGYYNPYRRGFYDPWGPSYGYSGFGGYGGGYCPSYSLASYGGSNVIVGGSDYVNGRNIQNKARTTRSSSTARSTRTSSDKLRVVSADSKIRVPSRVSNASASNGRTSKDYSKVQNEYYSQARRNSSSTKRISTSNNSRNSFRRTSTGTATRYASSISNNKPSRSNGYSSGYSRSTSKSSSSYSGNNSSGSRSRSSYSSPSKSNSSYSGSSSGSRSSSSSSGSSGSSSGSRSSSPSRSSGRH